jgi:hypothetical protein
MVLGIQQVALVPTQGDAQFAVSEQLILGPERSGEQEGAQAPGCQREVGLQYALELEQRLVVESDYPDLVHADAGCLKAIRHGIVWELRIALAPGEALLLGGGHHLAVPQQAGGAIVVVSGDA